MMTLKNQCNYSEDRLEELSRIIKTAVGTMDNHVTQPLSQNDHIQILSTFLVSPVCIEKAATKLQMAGHFLLNYIWYCNHSQVISLLRSMEEQSLSLSEIFYFTGVILCWGAIITFPQHHLLD